MTIDAFRAGLLEIEEEAEQKKKALIIKYCRENAKYKVGDIIQDHNKKILIEKVRASYHFGDPDPVYEGRALKKDGTPTKKHEILSIYQNNIVD